MSEQITYEGMMALFRETREQFQETREQIREGGRRFDESLAKQRAEFDQEMKERAAEFDRRMQESDQRQQRIDERIGRLGNRIGDIIEHMVAGHNIIKKFQAFDYKIGDYSRNKTFGQNLPTDMQGEIDLFLEDGNIAILIEVKATLETADVVKHMERLEKFRRFSDRKGDKRRFIGAVAGAVVKDEAQKFAHENGMYVIVQSGEAVEILPVPEWFQAKEW
jgi:hypothetical protein